jgi:predicted RNase H-like HicB family nuclease
VKSSRNQGSLGARDGLHNSPAREYIQQAVALAQWKKSQKEKDELGVRTLEDMSEDEILALEKQYKCPVIRPNVKRRHFEEHQLVATKVEVGEGWVGRIDHMPGVVRFGATYEEALDAVQGVVQTHGYTFDEETGERIEFVA